MRTLQEIFNLAIDEGFYKETGRERFMCYSINRMTKVGAITQLECRAAKRHIREYLNGWLALEDALRYNAPNKAHRGKVAIYRDWANRPKLELTPYKMENDYDHYN